MQYAGSGSSHPISVGDLGREVELAVLIGATLRPATEEHLHKAIAGYGVALESDIA
ncbi:hypothetical protein ACNKHV_07235 [Shigella flexneri]